MLIIFTVVVKKRYSFTASDIIFSCGTFESMGAAFNIFSSFIKMNVRPPIEVEAYCHLAKLNDENVF